MQLMPSCGQQAVMTAVSWVTKSMRPSCIPAEYKPLMLTGSARLHVASSTCWLWLMEELCVPGVLQTWASWVRSHVPTCTCTHCQAVLHPASIEPPFSDCVLMGYHPNNPPPPPPPPFLSATPYPCFTTALPAGLTALPYWSSALISLH